MAEHSQSIGLEQERPRSAFAGRLIGLARLSPTATAGLLIDFLNTLESR